MHMTQMTLSPYKGVIRARARVTSLYGRNVICVIFTCFQNLSNRLTDLSERIRHRATVNNDSGVVPIWELAQNNPPVNGGNAA